MASGAKQPQPQGSSLSAEPSATLSAELVPGTEIEGRYRVVQVIGVGGTGVVHEVEHLRTGQRLALKTLLDASFAPRLEQEARALAKLRSRRVVKVVDLGYYSGAPYLVMSLLEGRRLRDVLETRSRLSLPFIANLAVQVCEGLDEAHRAGLVHRDLKPDNLHLRERSGTSPKGPADELAEVTVFDFGVVKIAANEANSMLTRTGSTVGTPYYMSLEQLRGSGAVDQLSDIYALSVVLYECLAGARPFEAGTLGDLIYAICSTEPPDLRRACPDAPKEVVDVVMRGLSRTREERPKSTIELAKVFAPWADPAFTWWLRVQGIELAARPAAIAADHVEAALTDETTQGQARAPSAPSPSAALPTAVAPPTAGLAKVIAPSTISAPAAARPARPAAIRATASLDAAGPLSGSPIPFAPPRVPPPAPPSKPSAPSSAAPPISAKSAPAAAQAERASASPPAPRAAAAQPASTSGDRDTPTQMYLAGEAPSEHDDVPASFSTMALPSTDVGAALGEALARPQMPAPSALSNEDRTAIIGGPGAPAAPPGFDPRATGSASALALTPPASAQGPASHRSSLVDVGHTTSSGRAIDPRTSYVQLPGVQQPAPGAERASPTTASVQSSIDRALDQLGSRGNELGRTLMLKFRASSQETQLVVVIVGAAACAFVLVIVLYLLLA